MSLATLLRSIFRPRRFALQQGHQVELAFIVGGIEYFHFPDMLTMGFERALSALTFYEELRMRTTREYLLAHCEAIENILSNPKTINIPQLVILNKNLQDRLQMIIEPEIAYKLASVMYFDKTENPYRYDFAYGQQKIDRWKRETNLVDFFLSTPIKDLIPGLDSFEENLQSYSEVVRTLNDKTFTTILSHLSEAQLQHENVKRLRSQSGFQRK